MNQQTNLTLVLEATFTPSVINDSLPAVLGDLAGASNDIVVFTSETCRQALRPGMVPEGITLRSYPNYFGNPCVELDAALLGRQRPVGRLVALREFDLLRAARVRERLGLRGMKSSAVELFRDKLLMKKAARRHGIPTAEFMSVDAASDLLRAADAFGWPFIVKPRRKTGGTGFRVLRTSADIQDFCRTLEATTDWDQPLDFIAESFVGTRMYHTDGVWQGEEFVCFLANEYLGLKPHHDFNPANDLYPLSGSVSLRADKSASAGMHRSLRDLTRRLLTAFGDGSACAFHAEIWERDGKLLLNEIACRTGGGQVNEMQKEVFGKSPDLITLRAQAGLDQDVMDKPPREVLVARVPPVSGEFVGMDGALPDGIRAALTVSPGQRMQSPSSWLDSVG